MSKKIIILGGDPNSINSEIIYKCWKRLSKPLRNKIFIISNFSLLKAQFKKLNYKIKLEKIKNIYQNKKNYNLKIIDLGLKFDDPFKVSKSSSTKFVLKGLNLAHDLALRNDIKGLINCPIDKNHLNKKKIGVTEYLASKCKIKKNSEVMLISNKILAVNPITTHEDIKFVAYKLNKRLIVNKTLTVNNWYKKILHRKPKIAILGLNPHNAELRNNSEEKKIIIPAVKRLKDLGVKVEGPMISDTIFINDYKKFDVIVGMFHDQVLAPFKTLFKFDAINITLGLKYLRVSPDHGVAHNLIKKNKADHISLFKCIKFINKFGK